MIKFLVFVILIINCHLVFAEPYLAIREGMHCSSCHVNPTGGGMRNAFGNSYGQNQLAAKHLSSNANWTGQVAGPISLGGNARYSGRYFDVENTDTNTNFSVDRMSVYIGANLSEKISLMIDQQIAPGGSLNRESWVKVQHDAWYIKAGKIFQPFGWRIEDDSAFIRQVSGINFNTADNGFELGYEKGHWSAQFSITNGTGGGNEIDDGKQASVRISQVVKSLQWGVSANYNNADAGERRMGGIFLGVKTGLISWLAEFNKIQDREFISGDSDQQLGLLEANFLLNPGHNLKLTIETQQFESSLDDRFRSSLVYEMFPVSFTQLRFGIRDRESDDNNPIFSADEMFAQMHVYF